MVEVVVGKAGIDVFAVAQSQKAHTAVDTELSSLALQFFEVGAADAVSRVISDYDSALARAAEALKYVARFDIAAMVANYNSFYKNLIS